MYIDQLFCYAVPYLIGRCACDRSIHKLEYSPPPLFDLLIHTTTTIYLYYINREFILWYMSNARLLEWVYLFFLIFPLLYILCVCVCVWKIWYYFSSISNIFYYIIWYEKFAIKYNIRQILYYCLWIYFE